MIQLAEAQQPALDSLEWRRLRHIQRLYGTPLVCRQYRGGRPGICQTCGIADYRHELQWLIGIVKRLESR